MNAPMGGSECNERGGRFNLATGALHLETAFAEFGHELVGLGKDPGTITAVQAEVFEVRINTAAAKAFGLTVPESIVKSASKVFDK